MSKHTLRLSLLIGAAVVSGCGGVAAASGGGAGTQRPCLTAGVTDAGSFAWVAGGTLRAIDLRTCRARVLVSRGAAAPVRISPDGRWVGFGSGNVVPIAGGRVKHPLGSGIASWAWSPGVICKPGFGCTPVRLAGITRRGAVIDDTLGRQRRILLRPGFGAGQLLYDPSGGTLFVVRTGQGGHGEIWALDLTSGRARLVYRAPGQALPILAATSKLFAQVAFWLDPYGSASIAADGLPLQSVSYEAPGSTAEPVGRVSLVYPEFLTSCGLTAVLVSGGGRDTTTNKRLVSGAIGKPLHPITSSVRRAWSSPTCPAGVTGSLAASAGPAGADRGGFGHERRRIWLVQPRFRELTTSRPWTTDELPRFSRVGDLLTFVRTDGRTGAGLLYAILRPSGQRPRVVGPIVRLGRTSNYYGHYGWATSTDYHS